MLKTYHKVRLVNSFYLLKHVCNYTTQPMPKEKTQQDEQLKEFERISNIQRKIKIKKPQKPPFVKNLLLGVFDTDLLAYPELSNEELNNLNKNVDQARGFLTPEIKETKQLSKEFLKKLSSGGLLGLQASQLMNGRELTATETCRFFEIISEFSLKNSLINSEILGAQTLVKFGSDHLKRKYLQKLIDGDSLSAFCVVEPLSSKLDVFKLSAVKSGDGKTWILNGQKKLLINGSNADFFVVVAGSDYVIKDESREQKYTAFVVERDFGGITSTKQATLDPNLHLSDVVFDNTPIPSENIIGSENTADGILSSIYPEYRLSTGSVCSRLLKNIINNAVEYFIKNSKEPNFLYETDAVRIKLGEFVSSLYAVDSTIYLTSALIDNYENQDTELETAIVKVFSSEQAFLASSVCLDLIGPEAVADNHWCSQLHREATCQVAINDSNDNLKILIALFGLRHAGKSLNEMVKKLRNPLFYSSFILKRMWTNRRQESDNPKLDLKLHYYLHPSCLRAAKRLEYCVLRLQYTTEVLFSRYGPDIVNKHAELKRLAESMIDVYAMIACLGRSSRSYCIGLQHNNYEMTLSDTFTLNAMKRVKANLQTILDGPYQTTDENNRSISERLFALKQYYPVHPLTRNF